MNSSLSFLASPIVVLGFLGFYIWCLTRSPLLRWLSAMVALLLWGLITVGATLFVIIAFHIPEKRYGMALAALLAGGFVSYFWFAFGMPILLRLFRAPRSELKPWTN